MSRNTYISALAGLNELLDKPDASEPACQTWLEQHQELVFSCLGFRQAVPHPTLEDAGGNELVPDFMVERHDHLWEIVEIKRPRTRILKKASRRATFYAELHTYIAQCFEYCEFFDDTANRGRFEQRHGFSPQKGITAVLIAGRSAKLDRHRIFSILSRFSNRIRHLTYDDISAHLKFERSRLFAPDEGLSGLSIHLVVSLRKQTDNNFIFDIGTDPQRNRISIFVDPQDCLTLKILNDNGERWISRMRSADLQYEMMLFLSLELGFAESYTVLTIEVNGLYFKEQKLDQFSVRMMSERNYVLGSDLNGYERSSMDVSEVIVYGRTLNFHDKEQLKSYIALKYPTGEDRPTVSFEGGAFMHTRAHRNFQGPEEEGGRPTDMVQRDPDRQPKFLGYRPQS